MTIQVEVDAETEARLAAKARAEEMPLERMVARILEEAHPHPVSRHLRKVAHGVSRSEYGLASREALASVAALAG
jgi:hypothetical protein